MRCGECALYSPRTKLVEITFLWVVHDIGPTYFAGTASRRRPGGLYENMVVGDIKVFPMETSTFDQIQT